MFTTEADDSEAVTLTKNATKPPMYLLGSLGMTIILSFLIYWAPYFDWLYLWLENVTNDTVILLLNLTGVYSEVSSNTFPLTPQYSEWGEASAQTPGIHIPNTPYSAFWIIKACTGMQAGAILVSLIIVTPIPQKIRSSNSLRESLIGKPQVLLKLKVIIMFLIILFIVNSVRIWFHLYLVGAFKLPFSFAHDDLSKPIGFIGTLIFAWIIERQGIPIIDTFADWLEYFYATLLKVKSKIIA
ncbi:MAG: heimdallarchaeosortase [Candidatus Hodarchaeales archaeon]|jgi:hypothetical protein